MEDACSCSGLLGTFKNCELVLYYTTQEGLKKSIRYLASVQCSSIGIGDSGGSWPINSPVLPIDARAPTITLVSPTNNETVSSKEVTFSFSANDNNALRECKLFVNGSNVTQKTSGLVNGSNTINYSFPNDQIFDWNISCYDYSNNVGNSSTFMNINIDSNSSQITTCLELQDMNKNLSGNYELMNNINCSDTINWNGGAGFQPVGDLINIFSGNFNGNNNTIHNLTINLPSTKYIGLFGNTSGNISNVGLVNVSINGLGRVGSLVGIQSTGNIDNVYSTGSVTGSSHTGGLVGRQAQNATITSAYSEVNVFGGDTIGGLVGSQFGTITNSHTDGNVTGNSEVGGLTGSQFGTINNAHSTGNVTGDYIIGGLAGWHAGTINNAHSTSNVTGNYIVGGLAGQQNGGFITNTYTTGNITGGRYVGGLVGDQDSGFITNAYTTGNVTGGDRVGGLVGVQGTEECHNFSDNCGFINNSYSTGTVTGGDPIGGLVGLQYQKASITNSFWDKTTSEQTSMCGYPGGIGCTNTNGKTTAEMKIITTFTMGGWNISSSSTNLNNGYPFLGWQDNNSDFNWLIKVN